MTDHTIEVKLTNSELKATVNIMKELHDVDFFNNLSFDCFTALEAFLLAAQRKLDEEAKKIELYERMANRIKWADDRCECGHTAENHSAAGTGLCCAEGCPSCFKFKAWNSK